MNSRISRRGLLYCVGVSIAFTRPAAAEAYTFFRSPGCGCCHVWAERMNSAGLPVTLLDSETLAEEMKRHGVPAQLESCHVGRAGGYVISGHVPPDDFKRLLNEKPSGLGLAVPGMPAGSPGMENGSNIEPYEVLLFQVDGTTTAYANYG